MSVTEIQLDGLSVRIVGAGGLSNVTQPFNAAWNILRKRPAVMKKLRLLQHRLEGTHLKPGVVFLHTGKIPRTVKSFLDIQEHAGSPIIYVIDPATVNAPEIRSRIKLGNSDFYITSPRKKYSISDFEAALDRMVGLGKTVAIPTDDNRISDAVAATLSDVNLEDAKTGRLDALKIAQCYGIAPSALAGLVGVSRQSLLKTPDSANRQELLRPLAKLARLGIKLLGTEERFRAWLNEPNDELYGHATPLALIQRGQVADAIALVQDQLLGTPA